MYVHIIIHDFCQNKYLNYYYQNMNYLVIMIENTLQIQNLLAS